MMIGEDAKGFACYWKEPDSTDLSVEAYVLASFAGFCAEKRLRSMLGFQPREHLGVIWSTDWKEARALETKFSTPYLGDKSIPAMHEELEAKAGEIIAQYWPAIEKVAKILLGAKLGAEESIRERHGVERIRKREVHYGRRIGYGLRWPRDCSTGEAGSVTCRPSSSGGLAWRPWSLAQNLRPSRGLRSVCFPSACQTHGKRCPKDNALSELRRVHEETLLVPSSDDSLSRDSSSIVSISSEFSVRGSILKSKHEPGS
jgi:hypothetical protein